MDDDKNNAKNNKKLIKLFFILNGLEIVSTFSVKSLSVGLPRSSFVTSANLKACSETGPSKIL